MKSYTGALLCCLPLLIGFGASASLAAESTGFLGVSAVVSNTCKIETGGTTAQVMCRKAADVTLSLTGTETVMLGLRGASPKLIPLPATAPGGASILVIAY